MAKTFVALHDVTGSDGKVRCNVVKYGTEQQEIISQQPDRDHAEAYCRRRSFVVVGEQPELFTATDDLGQHTTKAKDGSELTLTGFQRRVLNRHAAAATLRKQGLLDDD